MNAMSEDHGSPKPRASEPCFAFSLSERWVIADDGFGKRNHEFENRREFRPAMLRLNQWALTGDWTVGSEAITSSQAGDRIVYRFRVLIPERPLAGSWFEHGQFISAEQSLETAIERN